MRSRSGRIGLVMGLGLVLLVGACVDKTVGTTGNPPPIGDMTEVRVLPLVTTSEPGLTEAFVAMAVFTSGRSTLVPTTVTVTWSSSDTSVATVDDKGTVKALKKGSAFITASAGGFSAKGQINVGPSLVSVQLSPLSQDGFVDLASSYQLIALYDDHSKQDVTASAVWSSPDATVAAVSDVGTYTGTGAGTIDVVAAYRDLASVVPASLSISEPTLSAVTVSPTTLTLAAGTVASVKATANDIGTVTGDATWTTSDKTIATVSGGLVTAVAAGTATITAAYTYGTVEKTADVTVTVTAAKLTGIAVTTPAAAVVRPVGVTVSFKATGTFDDGSTQDVTRIATWAIALPKDDAGKSVTVGTGKLSGSSYVVTTLATATNAANVTAAVGDVKSDATLGALTVAAAGTPTLSATCNQTHVAVGGTASCTASAVYTFTDTTLGTWTRDVSSSTVWEVSNATVGEVGNGSDNGTFTALKNGTVDVTGYWNLSSAGTATITVP